MNVLAVDIGNTDIKFGYFRDGELLRYWRASGTRTHPEKFSALLRNSLAEIGINFDALVYCSVVPEVEYTFRKTIDFCFNLKYPILAVDPRQIRLPLDTDLYPPEQLGTDRLVNACGAHLLYPDQDIIVVDFGTATTFDVVTADGRFLGGVIAPGFQLFTNALPEKTARLPHVEPRPIGFTLGRNTVECMEAGISTGYRGVIKELFLNLHEEMGLLGKPVLHIATGGLAQPFIDACLITEKDRLMFDVVEPALTLKGLFAIHEFNKLVNQRA